MSELGHRSRWRSHLPGGEGLDGSSYLDGPTEPVPIRTLLPAIDTPRLNGEDVEHISMLASSETALPPILVHRASLRVIDGSHRLRAAVLRGAEVIHVVYFDGSDEEAFVAAVEANTTHGLPLSLADRKAAAARILIGYPQWSDRTIARITGLAAKTVAAIRRPTGDTQRLDGRVGADGRIRPLNGTTGRLRAAEVIRDRPSASLREIAHAAGVSPMTARDVRIRLENGDSPTLQDRPHAQPGANGAGRRAARVGSRQATDPMVSLEKLRRDPSLRQTENGRTMLRQLDRQVRAIADYARTAQQVPPHCLYTLRDLARGLSSSWQALADELDRQLANSDH
jgi:ParB-like chromosome segregation protein Spo0J